MKYITKREIGRLPKGTVVNIFGKAGVSVRGNYDSEARLMYDLFGDLKTRKRFFERFSSGMTIKYEKVEKSYTENYIK